MNDYQPSDELIAFIKRPETEGLVLIPAPDPVGITTYGYGHRTYAGEFIPPSISEVYANLLLGADLHKAGAAVRRLVTVELTQAQFDGLTDFTFNLGEGALASSTMLSFVNREDWEGAAEECKKWVHDHAGHVLPGLVKRRAWDADHLIPPDTSAVWDPSKIIVNVPSIMPPADFDPSPSLPAPGAPVISGGGGDFAGGGASGSFEPTLAAPLPLPAATEPPPAELLAVPPVPPMPDPTPAPAPIEPPPAPAPAPAPEPAPAPAEPPSAEQQVL